MTDHRSKQDMVILDLRREMDKKFYFTGQLASLLVKDYFVKLSKAVIKIFVLIDQEVNMPLRAYL